jgi:hypothetical protein
VQEDRHHAQGVKLLLIKRVVLAHVAQSRRKILLGHLQQPVYLAVITVEEILLALTTNTGASDVMLSTDRAGLRIHSHSSLLEFELPADIVQVGARRKINGSERRVGHRRCSFVPSLSSSCPGEPGVKTPGWAAADFCSAYRRASAEFHPFSVSRHRDAVHQVLVLS